MDELSQPVVVQEARVNIVSLDSEVTPIRLVKSVDSDGEFVVEEDLPQGSYLVEALVPGYSIVSEKVVLTDSAKIKMQLKKLKLLPSQQMIHSQLQVPLGRGEGKASLTPPSL